MKNLIGLIIGSVLFVTFDNVTETYEMGAKHQDVELEEIIEEDLNVIEDYEGEIVEALTGVILMENSYHGDDVPKGCESMKWFGLFMSKDSSYYLTKSILDFSFSNDPIVDNEDEATGVDVESENENNSVVFISGLDYLKEREVEVLSHKRNEMEPGDQLLFNFFGISYNIEAKGTGEYDSLNNYWMSIENYNLTISATIDGVYISQVLLEMREFYENVPAIEFIGDIDGDGIIDLIIDDSNNYNVMSTTLFLSKPTVEDKILKKVANLTTTGC
jgi:hypothetical protein